jgi:hypothetical protein
MQPDVNWYEGNHYYGYDQPSGFDSGSVLSFRLIVVDVCRGGRKIYTSKTIKVIF